MNTYHDHRKDEICEFCGGHIPQLEHESKCAELIGLKWTCWTCLNHNPEAQALLKSEQEI
jgi:hypothetical protein